MIPKQLIDDAVAEISSVVFGALTADDSLSSLGLEELKRLSDEIAGQMVLEEASGPEPDKGCDPMPEFKNIPKCILTKYAEKWLIHDKGQKAVSSMTGMTVSISSQGWANVPTIKGI